jgi:hypothetical protein
VQRGHAAGSSLEIATDDLIHNPHLIECALAAEFVGQLSEQLPIELGNGPGRNIVWLIRHEFLSVPRISWM